MFSQVFCKRVEKKQWEAPTLSSIDDHFLWWTTLPSTRCSRSHKFCGQRIWYNMCSHELKSLFTGYSIPEFNCLCYHLQPLTKAGADFEDIFSFILFSIEPHAFYSVLNHTHEQPGNDFIKWLLLFMWLPKLNLRLPGLWNTCLYSLSHLPRPEGIPSVDKHSKHIRNI